MKTRPPYPQREMPLDDFALRGEAIYRETISKPQQLRAVDLPGPRPPANLVAPIQEILL